MVLQFAKVGEELEEKQAGVEGNQDLGFGPIKFELPIRQPNGEGKKAIAHVSLEFLGEV